MSSVIGWWKLISWTQKYDDGRLVDPFGTAVDGRLAYNEVGDFVVVISRPDRQPFVTGSQWTASEQEKAGSYDGMLAYYGRYELEGNRMSHHVKASLYPNWVGNTQIRIVALNDETLTLSARLEEATPEARTAELAWRRMTP
jgi:hypothetical protein